MNERDFEILLALNEAKNMTKAARKLYLSQPALTKRIQNIEEELGAQLLIRSTRGAYFTPMGEKTVETFRRISDNLRELREYIHMNMGNVGGSLHVGVPVDYARWYMPRMLEQYVRDYPGVTVAISTGISSHLYRRLLSEDLSCSLIRGEYAWNEEKLLLDEEPVCLACSEEKDRSRLSALTYMDRSTDGILHSQIRMWLEENHLSVLPKLHVDDIDTCQRLIRAGSWMIAPKVTLTGFNGYIEPLHLANGTPLIRRTYILCRTAYLALPQVNLFIEKLLEYRNRPSMKAE